MLNSHKRLKSLIVFILIGLVVFGLYTQRYEVFDWWRLRDYNPPSEISKLADDTQMTDFGRRLFYVNKPELNNETAFQQNCSVTEATIVLGCYVSTKGIYLFEVSDMRLAGIEEVTAAHEMLHEAYQRLSAKERSRIDKLINDAYLAINDERITATVATYRDRDPGAVPNELHSILGTEVETLPKELEDYYSQYFSDRSVIVKFSQSYENAFIQRRQIVAEYDDQLTNLKQNIESEEIVLEDLSNQLSSDRQELDALLDSGSVAQYNSKVPTYNNKIRSYNNTVADIRRLIDQYNTIISERNAIALEENELLKAIDSRPETIPAN